LVKPSETYSGSRHRPGQRLAEFVEHDEQHDHDETGAAGTLEQIDERRDDGAAQPVLSRSKAVAPGSCSGSRTPPGSG
jgi:hypothetical protein